MITASCTITFIDEAEVEYRKEVTLTERQLCETLAVPPGQLHAALQRRGDEVIKALWTEWLKIEQTVGDIKGISYTLNYAEIRGLEPAPQEQAQEA